jgi:hypothetical protein
MTTVKASDPHQFVVSDDELFREGGIVSARTLLSIACYVCGDKPGQGMHTPPPPPLHVILTDEVAKTLASIIDEPHDTLRVEAARAAFTTIQQVRKALDEMSNQPRYADPYEGGGSVFADVDTELNGLLTQLRRLGWDGGR